MTPAKPWMLKGDYNVNSAQQGHVPLQPARLRSSPIAAERIVRRSARSAGRPNTTNFLELRELELRDPREPQVRRRRVELGASGTMTNNLLDRLHEAGREPRRRSSCFRSSSSATAPAARYTSFGSEPFTPFNLLRYGTFQMQDSVTKFAKNHSHHLRRHASRSSTRTTRSISASRARTPTTRSADFYTDAQRIPRESEPHGVARSTSWVPGQVPAAAGADDAAAAAARRRLRGRRTSRTSGGRART